MFRQYARRSRPRSGRGQALRGTDGKYVGRGRMGVLGKILASIAAIFTQVAAASPGKVGGMGGMGMAVPVLATLAAPFLWVMSLLISGQVYGLAFVRTAPTLEARRWLVRQLFYGYSLICVGPVAVLTFIIHLGVSNQDTWKSLLTALLSVLGVSILLFVFRTARSYCKLHVLQNTEAASQNSGAKLHILVNAGFIFCTCVISLWAWEYAKYNGTVTVFSVIFLIGLVHVATYVMFQYFLRMSENEEMFAACPPIAVPENAHRRSRCVLELLRVFPFAWFPILAGIGHILIKNTHPLCTAIEIIGFTVVWMLLWRWNVQNGKRRWLRILVFFAIQTVIMYFVRANFYIQW